MGKKCYPFKSKPTIEQYTHTHTHKKETYLPHKRLLDFRILANLTSNLIIVVGFSEQSN